MANSPFPTLWRFCRGSWAIGEEGECLFLVPGSTNNPLSTPYHGHHHTLDGRYPANKLKSQMLIIPFYSHLQPHNNQFSKRMEMVISTHFSCNDLVHHPIDSQPLKTGGLEFQVCIYIYYAVCIYIHINIYRHCKMYLLLNIVIFQPVMSVLGRLSPFTYNRCFFSKISITTATSPSTSKVDGPGTNVHW